MKKMKWILAAGSFCVMAMASCGKVEDPRFRRLENFGVRNISLQDATIGFNATYFNPNKFGVNVKEAVFDFYADTLYLGKFLQPQGIDVNPAAEFSIPLEGRVSWQKVRNSGFEKLAGKEVLIKATGSVKVGKAGVYMTKNINYEGRHMLDLNLIKNPAGAGF